MAKEDSEDLGAADGWSGVFCVFETCSPARGSKQANNMLFSCLI